jgi:hypothetical protein
MINLNITPASQSRGEASQCPGTGDPSLIELPVTPHTNNGDTGDPLLIELPVMPHTNDGDMGDSLPVVPRTDDGDMGDLSPTESPADNRQGVFFFKLCIM